MDFIKSFYYGDVIPYEYSFRKDEQYLKAAKIFSENEKKLSEALSGEELKLFEEFASSASKIDSAGNLENFRLGFSLGVQLIYDSILENK